MEPFWQQGKRQTAQTHTHTLSLSHTHIFTCNPPPKALQVFILSYLFINNIWWNLIKNASALVLNFKLPFLDCIFKIFVCVCVCSFVLFITDGSK